MTQKRKISISDRAIMIDGKAVQIVSGAMHYFRIHPKQWDDRLDKAVAMGLNCLETYTCWNLHEPRRGEFNFKEICDIELFIRKVQAHGLYLILRPGPYICAEWENGGFPVWVTALPDIRLRRMNTVYLEAVEHYFMKLLPMISSYQYTKGGPIIMIQFENEYGSFGQDKKYLSWMRDLMFRNGIEVPLFTGNGPNEHHLNGGTLDGVLSCVDLGSNSEKAWKTRREYGLMGPDFCIEYWVGWFDHWGEKHHTRSAGMEPGGAAGELDRILASGANVNLYMFHGGTNFGFTNGANGNYVTEYEPTTTSYDYDSPLSECGDPTSKFYACQEVIRRYLPSERTEAVKPTRKCVPAAAPWCGSAELLPRLDAICEAKGDAVEPPTMDQLGQNFGFIHYRKRIQGPLPAGYRLRLIQVNDYAMVWLDGEFLGSRFRDTGEHEFLLPHAVPKTGSVLDVLVENCGRINYGPYLGKDPKGIAGMVTVEWQEQISWNYWQLPLEDVGKVLFDAFNKTPRGAVFHRAMFEVDEPGEAFLVRPGRKGVAWINGFNIGRYWEKGPSGTLYIPSPILRKGGNELIVLELEELLSSEVVFSSSPIL